MAEVKLTRQNFEQEAVQSELPVLIDFWATWCGPCRMIAPVVGEIADEYAGKIKVCKVNVDEEPELASAFRVASIPMLVAMKDGKVVNSRVGFCQKEKILELFD